jgi:hypothetical protein
VVVVVFGVCKPALNLSRPAVYWTFVQRIPPPSNFLTPFAPLIKEEVPTAIDLIGALEPFVN